MKIFARHTPASIRRDYWRQDFPSTQAAYGPDTISLNSHLKGLRWAFEQSGRKRDIAAINRIARFWGAEAIL